MPNTVTTSNPRVQLGGILIIHKSSSECSRCGCDVVITNYPCPGCGTTFSSAALSYIESGPDKQVANLIASGWNYVRIIGWAAGGMGNWRISADPHADFSTI